jgi:Skp family chaperone for outer membrane proteins
MKIKFFFLLVLFLGIGALTFAQAQTAAPAETKDVNTQVVAPDHAKTGECTGHGTMEAKADCKWVDANNDGVCDTCKKTEKECKEACKSAEPKTGCAMQKECGKSGASCCPSKDGKK